MKKIIIFAVLGIVLIGASVGGTIFVMSGKSDPAAEESADKEKDEDEEKSSDDEGEDSEEDQEKSTEKGNTGDVYHDFHPSFVVNIVDTPKKTRFLQVDIAVVTDKQVHIDNLKIHMPAIRHHLNILLSSQQAGDLRSFEGKEALREEALRKVRRVMKKKTGNSGIKDLYFAKFVIQ